MGDIFGHSSDDNSVDPIQTEALRTLQANRNVAPHQLAAMWEFGPQFAAAYGNSLAASYTGTLNAYENQIAPALARLNRQQRAADIEDVGLYGSRARQAIFDANPDQARLLGLLNTQAEEGLMAGSSLTPDEYRQMQNYSRGAFADRGLGRSNLSAYDEMMKFYDVGQERQAQRRAFAGNVLGFNQAVVGDPFQQILGRSGQSIGAATALSAQGNSQMAQSGSGNLYDPFRDAYSTMFRNQDAAAAQNQSNNQLLGAGISGGAAIGAALLMCWAAREVFGADNPKWLQFREWLLEDAPRKLRKWYIANGEKLAAALRANPEEKVWVREFMEDKIRESNLGLT